ncbi:MAG: 1-(5-phosphoribosyl)-5-[(5-phosphoribosylamino)methylideneamino]imidazole-4-carboxamide isomerase [Chloroflexota bacterium]
MSDFIVYPAIDLRNGKVVRLKFGDPDQQTDYGDDPAAAGQRWLDDGATWLHVVNLDGAFGEKSAANWSALESIASLNSHLQFGGGIRALSDVDRALNAGANRVILGTVAVEQPELVKEAIAQFGSAAIAVGIDARDGEVKTRGWLEGGGISPLNLAQQMADFGVETIIHTDISRDGVLTGVNAEKSAEISNATGLNVIGSGGVASLNDIQRCINQKLAGVITGRAIYEGELNLKEAIELC